uniref:G protein-coupled receptor 176 n=3 Tax=Phocoena sinus TaxID=42100 RepID=A0A8C9BCP1_PHOSS
MGHNGSWISRNASEPRNASGAGAEGANRSALGEFGEAQLYRQFTTTVQVVIFIGSLLDVKIKMWGDEVTYPGVSDCSKSPGLATSR